MYVFYSRVIEDLTWTLTPHCFYRRCNVPVDALGIFILMSTVIGAIGHIGRLHRSILSRVTHRQTANIPQHEKNLMIKM